MLAALLDSAPNHLGKMDFHMDCLVGTDSVIGLCFLQCYLWINCGSMCGMHTGGLKVLGVISQFYISVSQSALSNSLSGPDYLLKYTQHSPSSYPLKWDLKKI